MRICDKGPGRRVRRFRSRDLEPSATSDTGETVADDSSVDGQETLGGGKRSDIVRICPHRVYRVVSLRLRQAEQALGCKAVLPALPGPPGLFATSDSADISQGQGRPGWSTGGNKQLNKNNMATL